MASLQVQNQLDGNSSHFPPFVSLMTLARSGWLRVDDYLQQCAKS
ncbi:hypothetical protein [Sphingomonas sp. RB1R13]